MRVLLGRIDGKFYPSVLYSAWRSERVQSLIVIVYNCFVLLWCLVLLQTAEPACFYYNGRYCSCPLVWSIEA